MASVLLTAAASVYVVRHFAINTDISNLISPDLEWRKREVSFQAAFPSRDETIIAVVDAPTPELASLAANALTEKLKTQSSLFRSIRRPDAGEFFERNALLFLPTEEVNGTVRQLAQASPFIGELARDPSWRGMTQALQFSLAGLRGGQLKIDQLARPFDMVSKALEDNAANRPATFSWRELVNGRPAEPNELRRFIDIWPVLDFNALEPGRAATDAVRKAAADINLTSDYQARLRLTGPVPIADEEFSTVKEGALVNGIGTVIVVLVILWLALKSPRIILAVFIALTVGLAITAALGFMMVGALNLISVAFAVLFVGIGVDFGIQFSVRYRDERHRNDDIRGALDSTARHLGAPLTLAAAAAAAGFLSFLPTKYQGVSELGAIAGAGMVVAFLTSVTLLPALLKILNTPGEKEPLGYAWLAPVDSFLERHRIAVVAGTLIVAVAGAPLLYYLRFDFNPLNLRSSTVESIATYLDLRKDPNTGANSINILAPSADAARQSAEKMAALPEVSRVMTLQTFVPEDQQAKLAVIKQGAVPLSRAFRAPAAPKPTVGENLAALEGAAEALKAAAGNQTGPGAAAAKRLADNLVRVVRLDDPARQKAEKIFVAPLATGLDDIRKLLQAQPVTLDNLPKDLKDQWTAADGRTRVEVFPKGDPNDNETLRQFARAVLAVDPNAIGGPISILESGNTIVSAFIQAGLWSLVSITILLWIALRRFTDVLLTIVPLLVAGVLTLEICVLIGLPLNFANIIALPLLLGIGVAFKIYYIMAWRGGQTGLLQSSLTRAVFFSAMTTATAFGSLWLSSHPGTSSMGKLLALSLVTTLAAAVLFQPALMGKPRDVSEPRTDGSGNA